MLFGAQPLSAQQSDSVPLDTHSSFAAVLAASAVLRTASAALPIGLEALRSKFATPKADALLPFGCEHS
ncbi:hypothetical protein D3C84_984940 [compost metagenome]